MNNSKPYLLLLFSILMCVTVGETVYAHPNDKPPSLEKMYTQIGYTTIEDAVKEFENHFKCKVKLPSLQPSIPFTHQFGIFREDKKYKINDMLEIHYVNEKLSQNHFKIDIRPIKNKVPFEDSLNKHFFKLNDGQNALYIDGKFLKFFVFEKYNLQYLFGIDERISKQVTPKVLLEIANSID
ncbi:hypothetical protein [Bacillus massiliigorillae]|uniref:hypothetical protein n=1 Tax=Bacillus massiliigorillae TaxID=1243664 RepID=UPI0003A70526|nr:hypothetical protein [Bacillus massiliigorillae]